MIIDMRLSSKMPTRFSQTRKHRGHVSAGHGRVGKHRKHPGGRGLAGGQHHHRTNFDKYHLGYFGKVGMRYFHKTNNQYWRPVVNLDKITSLLPKEQQKALGGSSELVPVVDCIAHGYSKVLAKGRIPQVPLIVKARYVSRRAELKIKEAGGIVKIVA
ncbi:uncharacterized protein L969DRAFT_102868 [Mixia osmundae IAM 14324]|uniref:Large ribosomal subunit protein uL15/eL18 domain-containing protein n=1 Tax=Mixia osmundae (strain CBS 9802 / IAM 14324 / JCM 22182 / KY 12970) TaxID=764103 RepID=G7E8P5_MIXOS|nr:uncharacterized protein L969DRAFT_102868 [Mixia osmundae IAM 14324]KEI40149.1 hypothetical protein L969DRAFT_102868 [Mixia osmundae IAM 14324]GAA99513.1 hypothetical protein E5Q_06214 [Mixia osmundae IAM 14324]